MNNLIQKIQLNDIFIACPTYETDNFDFRYHIESCLLSFAHQISSTRSFFDYFIFSKKKHFSGKELMLKKFFNGLIFFLENKVDENERRFFLFLLNNNLTKQTIKEYNEYSKKMTNLKIELKTFYEIQAFLLQINSAMKFTDQELFGLIEMVENAKVNNKYIHKSFLPVAIILILENRLEIEKTRNEIKERILKTKVATKNKIDKNEMRDLSFKCQKKKSPFAFDFSKSISKNETVSISKRKELISANVILSKKREFKKKKVDYSFEYVKNRTFMENEKFRGVKIRKNIFENQDETNVYLQHVKILKAIIK